MMSLKGGDKAITTVVRRTAKGLEINVKLHPAVDDFMRAASGLETTTILSGRKWDSTEKLQVYEIPPSMGGVKQVSNNLLMRMDRPGTELFAVDPSSGLKAVNMSFIRLVGAASETGITFTIGGAYEREEVIWLGQAITEAGNVICKQYIYPMVISSINTVRTDFNGLQETVHQPGQ